MMGRAFFQKNLEGGRMFEEEKDEGMRDRKQKAIRRTSVGSGAEVAAGNGRAGEGRVLWPPPPRRYGQGVPDRSQCSVYED